MNKKKHKFCPKCGWLLQDIHNKMEEYAKHIGIDLEELTKEDSPASSQD